MSGLLEKVKNMGKGKYKDLMKVNPTVEQIQDKLSKYMLNDLFINIYIIISIKFNIYSNIYKRYVKRI